MANSKKRYFALACIACIILLGAFHRQLLPHAFYWLDVGEEPVLSKAVFVLFGDSDTRPFVAAALINSGFAEEIVMGQHETPSLGPQNPPGQVVYKRVMMHRGVPENRILVLRAGVSNTMNESVILRDYLAANPDGFVTVVTSHFHTRRTRWSLRRQLGPQADRLRFVSAPHDDFDASNWWRSPIGFESVLTEYIKLTAYAFVYGRAAWYCGGLFVAALVWQVLRRRRTGASESAESTSQGYQP